MHRDYLLMVKQQPGDIQRSIDNSKRYYGHDYLDNQYCR